jgi:(2R)-3-sulfolactate dehydrogenase (NADP+)
MPAAEQNTLTELARAALARAGAHEGMALATARALVMADMQGLATHGVSRVPFYCGMLRNGRANGAALPRVIADNKAVCVIDNDGGLGYEACGLAAREAVRRAREFGIAYAGITNGHHIGALALALEPMVAAGQIGIALSNSPAAMPAWGGQTAILGTNPVAAVFPRAGKDPVVVDLSMTTVTRGRIMLAAQKGERIPEGWALDRHGKPTTDPQEVLEAGTLFPVGGSKGAMLALVFELLCTALTGAAISRDNDSFFTETGNRPSLGQGFIAIDPGAAAGRTVYNERVEALIAMMLSEDSVRLPGSRRFEAQRLAQARGVEVPDALLAKLRELAGA